MDSFTVSLQDKMAARNNTEIQARLAWELLHLEMDYWRETKSLIHPHILALIHQRREALRELAKEETELLFRSALAANYGIAEWVERAREAGVPVDAISLEELRSDNFRMRAAAVTALGQLEYLQEKGQFVEPIIEMLMDGYPQVRVAAIRALERLQPEGAWRKHLVYECYVPAGEFVMGDGGTDLWGKKVHAHTVHVGAFYIGKYPVTNADFGHYVDDVGCEFELLEGKTDHPVVDVSWHQARDYAIWAGMRLLTEAEWEKAASWASAANQEQSDAPFANSVGIKLHEQTKRQKNGGRWQHFMERLVKREGSAKQMKRQHGEIGKRLYPWGSEFDSSRCNTGEAGLDDTTPVGMFSPEGDSPYGCADMVGNVWEWTSSLYRDYAYQADDGREDMSLSGYRAIRGGSFFSHQGVARCAGRFGLDPYFHNLYRGFRLGMSAT